MNKKGGAGFLIWTILVLTVASTFLLLNYFTSLFPNCDCFLDNIKSESSYISSELKYSEKRVMIENDVLVIRRGQKVFLLGIANKEDTELTLSIDIKEVHADKVGVITSGIFYYNIDPITILPGQIIMMPLAYVHNSSSGLARYALYVRNNKIQYGEQDHIYDSYDFTIEEQQ